MVTVDIKNNDTWDIYYIIDLRTREILDKCWSYDEVVECMKEYAEGDFMLLQNIEITRAINWEVKK